MREFFMDGSFQGMAVPIFPGPRNNTRQAGNLTVS
jgi:hypothetical protein